MQPAAFEAVAREKVRVAAVELGSKPYARNVGGVA